ncbi:MAG TPA: acetyl-CoA hydrolase/transferase C-terminal domain-containing protein [Syntrophomonadaceae bacterium]|nr:acetyl-CoA hydrolase/transferase C-terminal domain-containing protein [Syntrophomonadaceae bacterium]
MVEAKRKRGLWTLPWQQQYQEKTISAAQAVSLVRDHDVIALAGGSCIPEAFIEALTARGHEVHDVRLLLGFALKPYQFMEPEYKEHFDLETVFVGPMERHSIKQGITTYVPIHLQKLGQWLDVRRPNIVANAVTPPDGEGYMNRSLFAGLCHRRAFEAADTVIVEVNRNLPYLSGDDFKIHVSEVDYIIENDFPLIEIQDIEIAENERTIAGHIAEMIPNGSTIQLGLGGLANAVGYFLRDKKDLGVHAEVVSNSIMDLVRLGVANGSQKNFWPGKVLGCYCVGNQELWDFVNGNKDFVFSEVEYVNHPDIIGRNDNLISINNTLLVDLTGQAASESIGPMQYSGTGGQFNFVSGASLSRGGKSILALNSTFKDREGRLRSRIVPYLSPGTIVSTPRNDVDYVVTEYGAVNLRWQSVAERVRRLISVAHPDFRDILLYSAQCNHWI